MPPSLRLTFDDGPGPSTPLLLDVLKDASFKATFFVLGKHLAAEQDLAVRMLREGHTLGNHTWTHARPGDLSADDLIEEIEATDALIRAAHRHAGLDAPHAIALRLPYGLQADDPRRVVLDRLARPHAGWTLIVDDWRRPAPDAQTLAGAMLDHVAAQTASGHDAVICLHDSSPRHDTRPATVEAVQLLLGHADWRDAQ
ncbi:polysaccharide deacetylase family protein [Paraburkholderia bannensis]|uniref:polysaccharide deacetylase family protein n=1 Tax=Paraburkholderia bannensis TaxID=765414 RepID=UPI002AC33258|nr:polysaccharide deacetylase family protein [Paraburkholderia bannensis]